MSGKMHLENISESTPTNVNSNHIIALRFTLQTAVFIYADRLDGVSVRWRRKRRHDGREE